MKSILALIAAFVAAIMTIAAPAALANGQKQQIVRSNEPVPAGEQQAAARFNSCLSNEYSSKPSPRTPAVNNAMGRYRDAYTLVTRSITANNLPEFRRNLREAQIHAVEVGTTCNL